MPATIAGSHLGPDTHANRPAANAAGQPFGALYSCTTHGLIYKTDGSTWSTYATLGSGTLSDQGVVTYFDFTTAAAPSSPAAGKIRVYSKTGDHLAQKTSAGVETLLDATGGSGGVTHAFAGYNTVGGTAFAPTSTLIYMTKFTLATAALIASVGVYLYENGASAQVSDTPAMVVFSDSAGTPDRLVAAAALGMNNTFYPANDGSPDSTDGRWFHRPVGFWATAADWWIGVQFVDVGSLRLVKDGSGSDKTFLPGGGWIIDPAAANGTLTGTTDKYSIRASVIS